MDLVRPQCKETFKKTIAPKIAEAIVKNCKEPRYTVSTPSESFFSSQVFFLNIDFDEPDECKSVNLVVKIPQISPTVRRDYGTDDLFYNEILFYTDFARDFDRIPKCVFTSADETSKEYVIALENINQFGYRHRNSGPLTIDYAMASIRELARFHARSYRLQEFHPKEFFEKVNQLREFRYKCRPYSNTFNFMRVWIPRFIRNYVKPRYQGESWYWDKIESAFDDVLNNVFLDCIKPREPFAVLCHGDFNINNVLFKESDVKDDNDEKHIDARLIDFGMIRYASPTIDISSLLFFNCSKEFRKIHSVDILGVYHDTLLKYLREDGIAELEKYSMEAFLEDYRRHAVFNFSLSICYAPLLNAKGMNLNYFHEYKTDKVCEIIEELSDMNVIRDVTDLFFELKETGCLEHFLEKK